MNASTSTPSATAAAVAAIYPAAVVAGSLSLILCLVITPPMFWHYRNRNVGATAVIAWSIILNIQIFVNAVIWPNDRFNGFNGVGLCDIEVKLQMASDVALPASLGCVLRALARVMDTKRISLSETRAQKMRNTAVDLLWCIGFPVLQMPFHWIVQSHRYFIWGIAGCVRAVSNSWLTILLIYTPPIIWVLLDTYYAILILIRLYRYRHSVASILETNNTTKSRFFRLYALCLVWITALLPIETYFFCLRLQNGILPFSWSDTHSKAAWDEYVMIPSHGNLLYDRWIWLACGTLLFIFFGFGKEALKMYRGALLTLGLGRLIPILDPENRVSRQNQLSLGSKARLLLRRKTLISKWLSTSTDSQASTATDPASPQKIPALERIPEEPSKLPGQIESTISEFPSPDIVEKTTAPRQKRSLWTSLYGIVTPKRATTELQHELSSIEAKATIAQTYVPSTQLTLSELDAGYGGSCSAVVAKEAIQEN